jgi:hypothetical protein
MVRPSMSVVGPTLPRSTMDDEKLSVEPWRVMVMFGVAVRL